MVATRCDDGHLVVLASTAAVPVGLRVPIGGTVSGRAFREARTVRVHGSPAEQLVKFPQNTVALEGVGAQMITPFLRDGAPIGTLALHRSEIRPFSDREARLAESFADQAVIAIENARLFEEIQDRVGELQALGDVSQAVSSSLDLQEVLTTIVAHTVRLSGADAGTIYELDDETSAEWCKSSHFLHVDRA